MNAYTFGNYVDALRGLSNISVEAYFPLLIFVGFGWVLAKVFRAIVLDGHPLILTIAALVNYAIVSHWWNRGQLILAIGFALPLVFMGREAYGRLTK